MERSNAEGAEASNMKQKQATEARSPDVQVTYQDGKVLLTYKRTALTTKQALELLLSGHLQSKVCRFCLHVTYSLQDLAHVIHLASNGAIYKITIREMLATVHPTKVETIPDFPSKMCDKCLDATIRSYLFSQQCDQAERALQNFFDDIIVKIDKLDPLDRSIKKSGRHKIKPNHNVIRTEHKQVISYAEPARHLSNHGTVFMMNEPYIDKLECKKCWQLLPDIESLAYHTKLHPKSMWYKCRLCAKSFVRVTQYNDHLWLHRKKDKQNKKLQNKDEDIFKCLKCNFTSTEFNIHLQHIEKHKFLTILENLFEEGDINKLCAVCLTGTGRMEPLEQMISLHGGYPGMSGDRPLYNILGSTVPELNFATNYVSTNICERCIELAISSYIFICRTHFTRQRLSDCISGMLNALEKITEPNEKLLIRIDENSILPINKLVEYDANLLLDPEEVDESSLEVEVLEDEFRVPENAVSAHPPNLRKEALMRGTLELVNGIKKSSGADICSEFLTFNKNKTKPKTRICPLCFKTFISVYYLKKHALKHVNKTVQCTVCSEYFINKFHMHEHKKVNHSFKKLHSTCKVCGRTFTNESKMKGHKMCHQVPQCQMCLKPLKRGPQHHTHMQHHLIKLLTRAVPEVTILLTCCFCDKKFSSDYELTIHVNKVHMETKPYECDMCDRQYYAEYSLKQHKKTHSIRKRERCQLCDKTVSSRRALVIHVRKHSGVTPFKCQVCSWRFYTESGAIAHIKKWHGIDANQYKYVLAQCS